MGTFTAAILSFWRNNCRKFPAWAKAARMVFAMTPNSAGAERVFSLLEHFFGSTREGSLADEEDSHPELHTCTRTGLH